MIRIGHSYDIHRLEKGRKLILGGVELKSEVGLLGVSDADCLLHAIAESLLGALALGDLGKFFDPNDVKNQGLDSKKILKFCYNKVKEQKYRINNIDCMIFAEEPKMSPYIIKIRESISGILDIDLGQISVKATTFEKLDAIGAEKAIACESVCLIEMIE